MSEYDDFIARVVTPRQFISLSLSRLLGLALLGHDCVRRAIIACELRSRQIQIYEGPSQLVPQEFLGIPNGWFQAGFFLLLSCLFKL